MRLRRSAPTGPPTPMPLHLVGVGTVEDWVGAHELLAGQSSTVRPGEDEITAAFRVEAERRLDAARESWQRDQRARLDDDEPVEMVSETRPTVAARRDRVAAEIVEQRAWLLGRGARCEWRDLAAFERKAKRR